MHLIAIHSSDTVEIVHNLPPELKDLIQFVVIDPFSLTDEEVENLNYNNEIVLELPAFTENDEGDIGIDITDLVQRELNLDSTIIESEEYINILRSELAKYPNGEEESK